MITVDRGISGYRLLSATRPGTTLTNSTTSDQDFSSPYTIPANSLTSGKVLRVTINQQLANGVSAATLNQYVKIGGTKVAQGLTGGNLTDSVTKAGSFVFYIIGTAAPGASVSVECSVLFFSFTAANTGFGGLNSISQPVAGFDTTSALAIVPGATWSATGSTETLTLLSVIVEALN